MLYLREQGTLTTTEDLHELFKARFLSKRVKSPISKRYIKSVGSTTNLSTKQFNEYMTRIDEYLIDTFQWHPIIDNMTEADLIYYDTLI